jgi:hypothetical protein
MLQDNLFRDAVALGLNHSRLFALHFTARAKA